MGWLILVTLAALAAGTYLSSLWLHPWAPCRACGGSGRASDLLWRKAYGTCPSCGGRGRHPRPGIRVLQPGRARRMTGGQGNHKSIDQRKG